ncbi:hypothetical protein BGZ54_007126 [Gamsiella multidivaricata]|nr:hypothetical protein BGZ54_007126 [Gamsiella multidivaricata]
MPHRIQRKVFRSFPNLGPSEENHHAEGQRLSLTPHERQRNLILMSMNRLVELLGQNYSTISDTAIDSITDGYNIVMQHYFTRNTPAASSVWREAWVYIMECFRGFFPDEPLPQPSESGELPSGIY